MLIALTHASGHASRDHGIKPTGKPARKRDRRGTTRQPASATRAATRTPKPGCCISPRKEAPPLASRRARVRQRADVRFVSPRRLLLGESDRAPQQSSGSIPTSALSPLHSSGPAGGGRLRSWQRDHASWRSRTSARRRIRSSGARVRDDCLWAISAARRDREIVSSARLILVISKRVRDLSADPRDACSRAADQLTRRDARLLQTPRSGTLASGHALAAEIAHERYWRATLPLAA
jgi:hypothetical protein